MIPAARRRHRVTIRRLEKTDTGRGGTTTALVDGPTVRAEVTAIGGSEVLADHVLQGISVYRITMRWRGDLGSTDQLRYAGRDLNIRSADDPDGKRQDLVIIADTSAVQR